ncbi:AAA family ATPase [Dongshaea marina]|uniref:AAA family ATPase n=1 Tax=Dongshaea marina TaxID=2047966 RepID=UPI000D3E1B93|nr:ATP-binding protein [Dongshaea marina]
MDNMGVLIFFCGKMGSGKSTLAKTLASERNAVLLSEDEWLSSLYPNQITTLSDYLKLSDLIKPLIYELVQNILKTGSNVVMDFPANTISQREWFNRLCSEIGSEHEMFYLNVSNKVCLDRLHKRRTEQPERAKYDNEGVFNQVTQYFESPSPNEEMNIVEFSRPLPQGDIDVR